MSEQGYDATTVDQIAGAAGVSQMTFFRHFPTKAAVLMEDPFDPLVAAGISAQPTSLPPLQRACRGLRDAVRHLDLDDAHTTRQRLGIIAEAPGLAAQVWANTATTHDVMTRALAEHAPEPSARVAAAAVLGALMVALFAWGQGDADEALPECLLRALDVLDPEPAAGESGPERATTR